MRITTKRDAAEVLIEAIQFLVRDEAKRQLDTTEQQIRDAVLKGVISVNQARALGGLKSLETV
jgi:ribosomal protein S20